MAYALLKGSGVEGYCWPCLGQLFWPKNPAWPWLRLRPSSPNCLTAWAVPGLELSLGGLDRAQRWDDIIILLHRSWQRTAGQMPRKATASASPLRHTPPAAAFYSCDSCIHTAVTAVSWLIVNSSLSPPYYWYQSCLGVVPTAHHHPNMTFGYHTIIRLSF